MFNEYLIAIILLKPSNDKCSFLLIKLTINLKRGVQNQHASELKESTYQNEE